MSKNVKKEETTADEFAGSALENAYVPNVPNDFSDDKDKGKKPDNQSDGVKMENGYVLDLNAP